MDFVDVIGVAPGTVVVSAPMVLSGVTVGAKALTIVGVTGELSVNGGAWGVTGSASVGDQIRLRVTAPAGVSGETTTVTLSVQTLGYIDWTVTNVDNTLEEYASAGDAATGFRIDSGVTPAELATVQDSIDASAFLLVIEAGQGVDAATGRLTINASVVELAVVDAVAAALFSAEVQESALVADAVVTSAPVTVAELVTGADSVVHTAKTTTLVAEIAVVTDTADPRSPVLVFESAVVTVDALSRVAASSTLTDAATVAVATLLTSLAGEDVQESATVADALTSTAQMTYLVNGGVVQAIDAVIIVDPSHGAWTFNLQSFATTRWDTAEFAQVHQVDGVLYGISPAGVYRLDRTARVQGEVVTGVTDFGVSEVKALRMIYVSGEGAPVLLDTVTLKGTGESSTTYASDTETLADTGQYRIRPGKGKVARFWNFRVRNAGAAASELHEVRIVPLIGDRRV